MPDHGLPLSGRRVLVVEDEYFIAEEVAGALLRAGATVVGPVASEAAARGRIITSSAPIDWAVLDINLQGSLVYALADTLADSGIPFVFATGYADESIPERFRTVPRWGKPFDVAALVESLPHLRPASVRAGDSGVQPDLSDRADGTA